MAMKLQNTGGNGRGARRRGWLVWWTVAQGNYTCADMKAAAKSCDVPDTIAGGIAGAAPLSAWKRATQIGGIGISSEEPGPNTARYYTRNVGKKGVRVITREVRDPQNERVSGDTVAILRQSASGEPVLTLVSRFAPAEIEAEIRRIFADMVADYRARVGQMPDSRIRELLRKWLEERHRVCVRGTGGVYFIPEPAEALDADQVEDEVSALCGWLGERALGYSSFSVVEVYDGGATTLDTFRESAIEEVKAEIEDVSGRLDDYATNQKMNAGSRMYSSGQMAERLATVEAKVGRLKESLGEEIGVVDVMIEAVRRRALEMLTEAETEVHLDREAKQRKKKTKAKGKKRGTVKQRKRALAV